MASYAIVETEEGLTVREIRQTPGIEEEALRGGGVVVDPGPYPSYEEAFDAMQALEGEDPEDDLP